MINKKLMKRERKRRKQILIFNREKNKIFYKNNKIKIGKYMKHK